MASDVDKKFGVSAYHPGAYVSCTKVDEVRNALNNADASVFRGVLFRATWREIHTADGVFDLSVIHDVFAAARESAAYRNAGGEGRVLISIDPFIFNIPAWIMSDPKFGWYGVTTSGYRTNSNATGKMYGVMYMSDDPASTHGSISGWNANWGRVWPVYTNPEVDRVMREVHAAVAREFDEEPLFEMICFSTDEGSKYKIPSFSGGAWGQNGNETMARQWIRFSRDVARMFRRTMNCLGYNYHYDSSWSQELQCPKADVQGKLIEEDTKNSPAGLVMSQPDGYLHYHRKASLLWGRNTNRFTTRGQYYYLSNKGVSPQTYPEAAILHWHKRRTNVQPTLWQLSHECMYFRPDIDGSKSWAKCAWFRNTEGTAEQVDGQDIKDLVFGKSTGRWYNHFDPDVREYYRDEGMNGPNPHYLTVIGWNGIDFNGNTYSAKNLVRDMLIQAKQEGLTLPPSAVTYQHPQTHTVTMDDNDIYIKTVGAWTEHSAASAFIGKYKRAENLGSNSIEYDFGTVDAGQTSFVLSAQVPSNSDGGRMSWALSVGNQQLASGTYDCSQGSGSDVELFSGVRSVPASGKAVVTLKGDWEAGTFIYADKLSLKAQGGSSGGGSTTQTYTLDDGDQGYSEIGGTWQNLTGAASEYGITGNPTTWGFLRRYASESALRLRDINITTAGQIGPVTVWLGATGSPSGNVIAYLIDSGGNAVATFGPVSAAAIAGPWGKHILQPQQSVTIQPGTYSLHLRSDGTPLSQTDYYRVGAMSWDASDMIGDQQGSDGAWTSTSRDHVFSVQVGQTVSGMYGGDARYTDSTGNTAKYVLFNNPVADTKNITVKMSLPQVTDASMITMNLVGSGGVLKAQGGINQNAISGQGFQDVLTYTGNVPSGEVFVRFGWNNSGRLYADAIQAVVEDVQSHISVVPGQSFTLPRTLLSGTTFGTVQVDYGPATGFTIDNDSFVISSTGDISYASTVLPDTGTLAANVTATDGANTSAPTQIMIQVISDDRWPTSPASQEISGTTQSSGVIGTLQASDPDGDPITEFVATSGMPSWASLNAITGEVSVTNPLAGTYPIEFTVRSQRTGRRQLSTGGRQATIVIQSVLDIPQGQSVQAPRTLLHGVIFGQVTAQGATSFSTTSTEVSIDNDGNLSWTGPYMPPRDPFTIDVTASDGTNTVGPVSVTIDVQNDDTWPTSPASQSLACGTTDSGVIGTLQASDVDGDPIIEYTQGVFPSWATLNTQTGEVSVTNPVAGNHQITFGVKSQRPGRIPLISNGRTATITVSNSLSIPTGQVFDVGRTVHSGSIIGRVQATGGASSFTSDDSRFTIASNGDITFTTTSLPAEGDVTVNVTASDGTNTVGPVPITISFTHDDRWPWVNANQSFSATTETTGAIGTIQATEPDNDPIIEYELVSPPAWLSINATTGELSVSSPPSGTHTIQARVISQRTGRIELRGAPRDFTITVDTAVSVVPGQRFTVDSGTGAPYSLGNIQFTGDRIEFALPTSVFNLDPVTGELTIARTRFNSPLASRSPYVLRVKAISGADESPEETVEVVVTPTANKPSAPDVTVNISTLTQPGEVIGHLTIDDGGDPIGAVLWEGSAFTVSNDGTITLADGNLGIGSHTRWVTIWNLGYGSSDPINVTINVENAVLPTVNPNQSFNINSGAPMGTSVGIVQADQGSDPITSWALSGDKAWAFSIGNSQTPSEIKVGIFDDGVGPAHTDGPITPTVTATNKWGSHSEQITIDIDATAAKPTITTVDPEIVIPDTTGNYDLIATLGIDLGGGTATRAYSLNSMFDLDVNGELRFMLNSIDVGTYETDLRIRTKEYGWSDVVTQRIRVMEQAAPVVNSISDITIQEALPPGQVLATVSAQSATPVTTWIRHSVTPASETNKIGILSNGDGTANVITQSPLDYETAQQITVAVIARNDIGDSAPESFTITVTDANEPPVFVSTPVTTATYGTLYSWTAVAQDPEGQAVTYRALSLPAWLSFDETTGVLSGAPSSAGVFSVGAITARDPDGNTGVMSNFDITVSPIAPVVASGSYGVAAPVSVGQQVFTVSVSPGGEPVTGYELRGTTDFEIDTTGRVSSVVAFDALTDQTVTMEVRAIGQSGLVGQWSQQQLQITELDLPPRVEPNQVFTVQEGIANGAVIGTVQATDPNGDPIQAFTITNNPGPSVAIAQDGVLTVMNPTYFDYEQRHTVTISVAAIANNVTGPAEQVTINITNTADVAPVIEGLSIPGMTIQENTPIGTVVGEVVLQSAGDSPDSIAFSSATSEPVAVHGDGKIVVTSEIDYETVQSFQIRDVTATSASGSSAPRTFTIQVSDIASSVTGVTVTGPSTVVEGDTYIAYAQVEGTLEPGEEVQWTIPAGYSGMTIDSDGVIRWTVPGDGSMSYHVRATIGGQSWTTQVSFTAERVSLRIDKKFIIDRIRRRLGI